MNCKLYLEQIFEFKNLFNPDCILIYISLNSVNDMELREHYNVITSFNPLLTKHLREYLYRQVINKNELDKIGDCIKCYVIKMF